MWQQGQSYSQEISAITNIPIWGDLGKYLSVPFEWGGSKVQGLNWLKEKVLDKMECWKEVLIKDMIQAIPSYVMSIFSLPKTFASITAYVANFWWKSNGKYRGVYIRRILRLFAHLKV